MSDPIEQIIQTQHPEIASDIQSAINALRKLQMIAGVSIPGTSPPAKPVDPQSTLLGSNPEIDNASATLVGDDSTYDGQPITLAQGEFSVLAAGDSFGRYQIVRLLGKGAMGMVYLAYDGQLQRHVALKQPMLTNENMTKRFYREARATAMIRSPYICPMYDVGHINGMHFISMAYIEGETMSAAIKRGEFKDPLRIVEVISKIALGLQKAHDENLIHRDLKPDNIMIDSDGEPVIMDFGLARRVDDDARLSQNGALIGSPAYMSPEQVAGNHSGIGTGTDIYSLGVVLFETLTGRIPFTGSLLTVLRQVAENPPPSIFEITPALQDDSRYAQLGRISIKMMAKKPEDRFASAAEVADALKKVNHELRRSSAGSGGNWLKSMWPFGSSRNK